jgi:hypothetical protein
VPAVRARCCVDRTRSRALVAHALAVLTNAHSASPIRTTTSRRARAVTQSTPHTAAVETPCGSTQNPIEHPLHIPRVRRRHRAQLIEGEPVRQFPCRRPELGIIGIVRELREYRSELVGVVPHFAPS